MKIKSRFAILDVLDGRNALKRHLDKQCGPVEVTIKASITSAWGSDDGVSREFECVVHSVKIDEVQSNG